MGGLVQRKRNVDIMEYCNLRNCKSIGPAWPRLLPSREIQNPISKVGNAVRFLLPARMPEEVNLKKGRIALAHGFTGLAPRSLGSVFTGLH